jgi:pimeloyl-ACP methyl ester carboxylesterase
LFLVDDSGAARPTIIYNSGYDSTREESYFVIAAAALRRGYNVLAFDGPGQGAVLREQKLVMRPDWEAVIIPVVDYALTCGEIAAGKIVLFGYSLGGYLVARAAAFEHRVAALILDDGIHDFHAAFAGSLPPFIGSWIADGRDDVAVPVLTMLTAVSTQLRWGLRNGMWVFGAGSFADLIRKAGDYTLDGVAHQITAPTLIMDPDNDRFLKGQPQLVLKALTSADATLVTLTSTEGAGEHTHAGALGQAHQVMFDWLDITLTR